jgi:hypothetical protein
MRSDVERRPCHPHAAAITAHLGPPGRMVGLSKSGYMAAHLQHVAAFNANVCFGGGKVGGATSISPSMSTHLRRWQRALARPCTSSMSGTDGFDMRLLRCSSAPSTRLRPTSHAFRRSPFRMGRRQPFVRQDETRATAAPPADSPAAVAILDRRERPRGVDGRRWQAAVDNPVRRAPTTHMACVAVARRLGHHRPSPRHSQKPDEVYQLIEAMYPRATARTARARPTGGMDELGQPSPRRRAGGGMSERLLTAADVAEILNVPES